jgi:hypothetical protein
MDLIQLDEDINVRSIPRMATLVLEKAGLEICELKANLRSVDMFLAFLSSCCIQIYQVSSTNPNDVRMKM